MTNYEKIKNMSVEEMARTMCKLAKKYDCCDCDCRYATECTVKEMAELLYNAGYRKIPENVKIFYGARGCGKSKATNELLEKLGYVREKQGKWVYKDEDLGCDIYMCSSCKEEYCLETGSPQDNFYNYCPNCGARMVGDSE